MLLHLVLLFVLALFPACGDTPVPPFAFRFDDSLSASDREAVLAAAEEWNDSVGVMLFDITGDSASALDVVEVHVVPHLEKRHVVLAGCTAPEDRHYVVRFAPGAIQDGSTVEHELGHTLGLGESHEPDSVMFWMWTPEASHITAADVAAVRRHWGL